MLSFYPYLILLLSIASYSNAAFITDEPILEDVVVIQGEGEIVNPDLWTPFPTAAPVVTLAPSPWPTDPPTPEGPIEYVMFPQGILSACSDSGGAYVMPEAECLAAAEKVTKNLFPAYNMPFYMNPAYAHMMNHAIPCGCYIREKENGSHLIEFNGLNVNCTADPKTELVCKVRDTIKAEDDLATKWTKVYGDSSFPGTTDSSKWGLNQLGGEFLIRRICNDCVESHQDIIYKRLTPLPYNYDVANLFLNNWSSSNNVLNLDFKLFDDVTYAMLDLHNWDYCNYDDGGIGFPRDCGPDGGVGSQWNSLVRGGGKQSFAYYVWNGNPAPTTSLMLAYLGHTPPAGGFTECQGDCDYDAHCAAGLVCMERSSGNPSTVPGCIGNADAINGGWVDFCVPPGSF